jgi:hypothetical protein
MPTAIQIKTIGNVILLIFPLQYLISTGLAMPYAIPKKHVKP